MSLEIYTGQGDIPAGEQPKEYALDLPYGSAYADRVRDTTRWGEAILQWRFDQRMTQEQTAKVLGLLSFYTISSWERGRAVPAPRKAAHYWAVLMQYAKDRLRKAVANLEYEIARLEAW